MIARKILKIAAEKIADPAAWGKGRRGYDRDLKTCCIAEAIEEAIPGHYADRSRAMRAVYKAAGLEWRGAFSITQWNDAAERTHREVIAVLRLARATLL